MTGPYDDLLSAAAGLLDGETDMIANAANVSAAIFAGMADLNWAGFYFVREGALVLGPFQGRPACVRIAIGAGVCGTAAARRETVVVADVHDFPGHIACDAASRSEIVVPLLLRGGDLIGVLDIDSPLPGRFGHAEQAALEAVAARYVASLGG